MRHSGSVMDAYSVGLIIGGMGGLVMGVSSFALVPGVKGVAFGVLFGAIGVTQLVRYIRRRR